MNFRTVLTAPLRWNLRVVGVWVVLGILIYSWIDHERSRRGGNVREIPLHTSAIQALAFSPDGRRVATASLDNTVRLWNSGTWSELEVDIRGLIGFSAVAFSPDGESLAAAGGDGRLSLWNLNKDRRTTTLTDSPGSLRAVAFSPDGATVATGADDGIVRLWNVAGLRRKYSLAGHTRPVMSVAFQPEGRRLASVGRDGRAIVWDLEAGKMEWQRDAGCGPLCSVAFAPDGQAFAVSGELGIAIIDVKTGRSLSWRSDQGEIRTVRYLPEGKSLASISWWGTISLWDVATYPWNLRNRVTDSAGLSRALAVSPDGTTLLATAGVDATLVKVVDLSGFRDE